MLSIKKSSLSIIVIVVLLIWNSFNESRWNSWGVMVWDVACYYGYLTKAFNHKTDELTPDEKKIPALFPANKYVKAPNGNLVLKTTMGMSVLYFPFYGLGYILHTINHGHPGTGVEVEYRMMMQFVGTFYLLLALLLLRYFLRKYFTDGIVAISLVLMSFGTNAFYYTTYEGCMTHVPDMFLFLLFLYATVKWYERTTVVNSIALGLLAGLVSLIRPTNALIGIFFLLYGVVSWNDLRNRFKFLLSKWHLLFLLALCAIIVWIPQMIYWHHLTGHYFFFSYVGERFYFDRPRIFLGMLGGRKGWLLYTPLGFLMLFGLFFMFKRVKEFFVSTILFYVLYVWMIFSWWCWWYGGSYSCRPMVEVYGILAFPLASLLSFIYLENKPKMVRIAFSVLLFLLLALSVFQTWQYKRGIIHYDSMNYKAYRQVFFKLSSQSDSIFTYPPWDKAGNGEYAE